MYCWRVYSKSFIIRLIDNYAVSIKGGYFMPVVDKNKGSGTWWKVLLGVLGGFFLGAAFVVGSVITAAAVIKPKTILGNKATEYLTEEYVNKSVLNIVSDAIGGKMSFDTIGDIRNITPVVDNYVDSIVNELNGMGCELTKEEVYTWKLEELGDNLFGSVNEAKLVNVLSDGENPSSVIAFFCYRTDENGNFVLDAQGNKIPQTLSTLMNDPNYLSSKIDTMKISTLFSQDEINNSAFLKAIANKTVNDLSKDGAFDDVKISDIMGEEKSSDSAIVKALKKKDATIGNLNEVINDLYVSDVIEPPYSSPALKKMAGADNSTEEYPNGPKLVAPYQVMHYDTTPEYPTIYEYFVISDAYGHRSDYIPFKDVIGTYDEINDRYDGKASIAITDYNSSNSTYNFTLDGIKQRINDNNKTKVYNLEMIEFDDIDVPPTWGSDLFILSCNKKTKINDFDSSVHSLLVCDVMDLKIGDALWKVKDEEVSNGKALFDKIEEKLYVSDIMEDYESVKFINKIPENTPIKDIGKAVNNLKLIDAFEENMYDSSDEIKPTWKYMLIEEGEPWIDGKPNKSDNPFAGYNCESYKLGGKGTSDPGDSKGIDAMIDNLTYHMKNDPMKRLHDDGILPLEHYDASFFEELIPDYVKTAHPDIVGSCTKYGQLSFTQFVSLMTHYLPSAA